MPTMLSVDQADTINSHPLGLDDGDDEDDRVTVL